MTELESYVFEIEKNIENIREVIEEQDELINILNDNELTDKSELEEVINNASLWKDITDYVCTDDICEIMKMCDWYNDNKKLINALPDVGIYNVDELKASCIKASLWDERGDYESELQKKYDDLESRYKILESKLQTITNVFKSLVTD